MCEEKFAATTTIPQKRCCAHIQTKECRQVDDLAKKSLTLACEKSGNNEK